MQTSTQTKVRASSTLAAGLATVYQTVVGVDEDAVNVPSEAQKWDWGHC